MGAENLSGAKSAAAAAGGAPAPGKPAGSASSRARTRAELEEELAEDALEELASASQHDLPPVDSGPEAFEDSGDSRDRDFTGTVLGREAELKRQLASVPALLGRIPDLPSLPELSAPEAELDARSDADPDSTPDLSDVAIEELDFPDSEIDLARNLAQAEILYNEAMSDYWRDIANGGDFIEPYEKFQQAIELGLAKANSGIAPLEYWGLGEIPRDAGAAARRYAAGSDGGDPQSMFHHANNLRKVGQDFEGERLMQQSADLGNRHAIQAVDRAAGIWNPQPNRR